MLPLNLLRIRKERNMSIREDFNFPSHDGRTNIHGVLHIPDCEAKGIVQITHGMVEFIDRYNDFAAYLASEGYIVVGHDHLGHGESVCSKDDYGYFAEKNGNSVVLADLYHVTVLTKKRFPNLPYVILGHSMGSFYARQYLFDYGKELDGAIIMGTGHLPEITVRIGRLLTKVIACFKGWRHRSKLINFIALGSYNKKFEPARTRADWLTKDEKIVDFYVGDERCSFLFTLNGYFNMFTGILRLHDKRNLEKMPAELPILIVSGADDPVGEFGTAINKVAESFVSVGMKDVSVKLYPNDRHEILNETDKDVVYADIALWINNIITKRCR